MLRLHREYLHASNREYGRNYRCWRHQSIIEWIAFLKWNHIYLIKSWGIIIITVFCLTKYRTFNYYKTHNVINYNGRYIAKDRFCHFSKSKFSKLTTSLCFPRNRDQLHWSFIGCGNPGCSFFIQCLSTFSTRKQLNRHIFLS